MSLNNNMDRLRRTVFHFLVSPAIVNWPFCFSFRSMGLVSFIWIFYAHLPLYPITPRASVFGKPYFQELKKQQHYFLLIIWVACKHIVLNAIAVHVKAFLRVISRSYNIYRSLFYCIVWQDALRFLGSTEVNGPEKKVRFVFFFCGDFNSL